MPTPKVEDPRTLFWPKVHRISDGCWEWIGAKTGSGYGNFSDWRTTRTAHKFLWKNVMGLPYPKGCELHHKCRNKACVNPAHLELLTRSEHQKFHFTLVPKKLKTHCLRGHEFTPENTYVCSSARGNIVRICIQCRRERARIFRKENLVAERERHRLSYHRHKRLSPTRGHPAISSSGGHELRAR